MNERSVTGLFAWLYYVSSRRRISLSLFSTSITPRASSQRRFNSSACCMAASRSSERDSGYLMCLGEEGLENSSKWRVIVIVWICKGGE